MCSWITIVYATTQARAKDAAESASARSCAGNATSDCPAWKTKRGYSAPSNTEEGGGMMIVLVRVVQTCMACPSQWDAWDADGNYYYLRYRSGHGEIRRYRTEHWVDSTDDEYVETVGSFDYGHPLDGSIDLTDFARLAGIALAPGLAHLGNVFRRSGGYYIEDYDAIKVVEDFYERT